MPTLSIVMPARDAEQTLPMAIQSCLAQTLPDFELVLVDHGSIDGTFSLMKKYARRDSRIDVLKKTRTTPFATVANLAWQESRGQLIARMDADDFSYPARLQHQTRFLADHPEMDACGSLVRIRKRRTHHDQDDGLSEHEAWINSLVTPESIARERFVASPMVNPSLLIRRSALERFGGYATADWAEDYDLWLRMMEAGATLGKVEKVLLDWFDSDTRASRTMDRHSADQLIKAKAHHLARVPLIRQRGVSICGTGNVAKKLARQFAGNHGITVGAFFEMSESRIGKPIEGVPVLPVDALLDSPHRVLLGAFGGPDGRAQSRALASETGFTEGLDFFCVA